MKKLLEERILELQEKIEEIYDTEEDSRDRALYLRFLAGQKEEAIRIYNSLDFI